MFVISIADILIMIIIIIILVIIFVFIMIIIIIIMRLPSGVGQKITSTLVLLL